MKNFNAQLLQVIIGQGGFIAGILTGLDGYIVKSNREGGDGRTDIYVKPVNPFGQGCNSKVKEAIND